MPYLRTVLKRGSQFVFRGRIVRKQSHLEMEHPEVLLLPLMEKYCTVYNLCTG